MKFVSYSAPAKVILSGEHTAVYGRPALAAAINLRLNVIIWEEKVPALVPKHLNKEKSLKKEVPIEAVHKVTTIVKDYLKSKQIDFEDRAFDFDVRSIIPLGRGLGSSAALSVASTASLLEWYTGRQFEKEVINTLAYKVEKYFHKNPSGIDNSTSCFGGLIYYRKEFEFLKNVSSLTFKIPQNIESKLILIDSGEPEESTAVMVAGVGEKYNSQPHKMDQIMQKMEKVTKRLVVSLVKEDPSLFSDSISQNHLHLVEMGVVSSSSQKLLSSTLSHLGTGKITGAGGRKKGSGYILFFANNKEETKHFLHTKNIPAIDFKQDYAGIKKEDIKL